MDYLLRPEHKEYMLLDYLQRYKYRPDDYDFLLWLIDKVPSLHEEYKKTTNHN